MNTGTPTYTITTIEGKRQFEQAVRSTGLRVNLGCGKFPLEGYFNVDEHEEADAMGDVFGFRFADLEEVRMDHFLEHISHTRTLELLKLVHGWLKRGGLLVVEVPDMRAICERPPAQWQRYIYGSQQHEGEYHRAGFTSPSLQSVLMQAGFRVIDAECFRSRFPTRREMPCLRVQAIVA